MGLSSSKSKTTTNQKTTEQASTTPTNPQWVTDAMQGFTDRVNQFGQMDPQSLVAGPSALQQSAFGQAGNLGGWQASNQAAQGMASAAGGAGPNLAGATGYQAPIVQAAQLGGPSLATSQGYTPQTMQAAQSQATLFNAPKLGDANTYQGQGYTAALAAAKEAQASRASEFMKDYQNPYQSQVVDAYKADFEENAGKVRAQQAAAAARNRAFGSSRYGLQEAQTEGELSRARAAGLGDILSKGFQFSAQMGDADANRFTNTSGLNAQLGTQTNIANAGFQNDASRFSADALNQSNAFNANAKNAFALNQGQMDLSAISQNASALNQTGLANAGFQQQANAANMDAGNRAAEFGTNWLNQTNAANTGYQNQFALSQFGADNQRNLAQAGFNADAAQFGANAFNQNQMFNAGQQDNALARQLQAAGLLGDLGNSFGANQRADIGMTAELGNMQRQIAQQQALAPLAQLEAMGQLYGNGQFGLFRGQNVVGSGTMDGTSVTKSSPNIFQMLLQGAQNAAGAYAAGK